MSFIAVGPKIGDKQSITLALTDRIPVTYMSTPEKIDNFQKELKQSDKKQNVKSILNTLVGTGVGVGLGALLKFDKYISRKESVIGCGVLGLFLSIILTAYQQTTCYDKNIKKFIQENPQ